MRINPLHKTEEHPWVWQQIHWKRPVQAEQIQNFLEQLASDDLGSDVIFETRTTYGEAVAFYVATRPAYVPELKRILESTAVGTTLSHIPSEEMTARRGKLMKADRVSLGHPSLALNTDRMSLISLNILSAMAAIKQGEGLVLQVVLGRRIRPREISKNLRDPRTTRMQEFFNGSVPLPREMQANLQRRYSMHGFKADVRVGAIARTTIRANWLIEQLASGLKMMEAAGVEIDLMGQNITRHMTDLIRPHRWYHTLSSSEVACVLAVPYGEANLPGVPHLHPVSLRVPTPMNGSTKGFAVTNDPSKRIPIGISAMDSLRHTLLLGPTGVGKSTAMLNMILSDIDDGHGVLVIDPKGDLNAAVLARMNRDRAKDVVYIDPMADRVVGINPLSSNGDPDLVADGMLAVLREIFASSWGQRTEDILSNALMTLTRTSDNVTLSMLPSLLYNPTFRRKIVEQVTADDPIGLGSFWQQYDAMSPAKQQEITAPLMNKLRTVLTRKPLLRTIGQPRANFDLKDLFTGNKIVLVSLNKARVGATSARFLGSIILSQVWALTQAQAELPESQRPIIKVYVDEMQDYLALPLNIADALSQARSYHVGFTLAHQYRDQVKDKELLSGIDANVAHKVIFTLNDPDARQVASQTNLLMAEDFKYLPRHNVYIQTLWLGQKLWLSAETLPAPREINNVEAFKKFSLGNYGRAIADIDEEIRSLVSVNQDISSVLKKTSLTTAVANPPMAASAATPLTTTVLTSPITAGATHEN